MLSTILLAALAVTSAAQSTPAQTASGQTGSPLRINLPTINVSAQKEPADKQKIPVSVTAVPKDAIDAADMRIVSDAAILAPNAFFTEATARKLSNARFRGIGASPANPAITTYFDGVPQLNANSSSLELLDIEQIEFVRGPQSALYGRNTLGGLVNVWSARPSTSKWSGTATVPFGNYGSWAVRGAAGGPIVEDKLSLGVAFAQVDRDGFTENIVTHNDLDSRSAFTAKAQLLWVPNRDWEARVIVSGEHAEDGDYALNDVGALRARPFEAARDFEGRTDRDIFGTTILARRAAGAVTFTSTTGFLKWDTEDVTDLDYTPAPLITRDNSENSFQFTQEVRFASAETSPVRLSDSAELRWQSGVFLFTQNYEQDAINNFSPFVLNSQLPLAVAQHSPRSALDDFGLGVFGHATVTFNEKFDLSGGLRVDYENKNALLETFYEPAIAPMRRVDTEKSFSNVSPQVAAAFRFQPDRMAYATVARGYKAGGFNPASPAGSESYGEESSWNIEGGVKTLWADGRVSANAAVFYIDWDDLQFNAPDPQVPASFYITNVGSAASKGAEFEIGARVAHGVDLFTAIGFTHARFGDGAVSSGFDVDGNTIPNTPGYTTSFGAQYSRAFGSTSVVARGDAVFYGAFKYDDLNTMEQEAYSLVNLRFAATRGLLTAEFIVRNLFDTEYIPFAFPYPGLAPSGFIGEMGAPRTISFGIGVRF